MSQHPIAFRIHPIHVLFPFLQPALLIGSFFRLCFDHTYPVEADSAVHSPVLITATHKQRVDASAAMALCACYVCVEGLSFLTNRVDLRKLIGSGARTYRHFEFIYQLGKLIFDADVVGVTMVACAIMTVLLAMISAEHKIVDNDVVSKAHRS
jgi:hypothetical protein